MDKQTLRKNIKQSLREQICKESSLHELLSENLLKLLEKLKTDNGNRELSLGVYAPIEQEPIWFKKFSGKEVSKFLLVHMHEKIDLSYHPVELTEIECGEHQLILEESIIEVEETPDVILIPGLAFTNCFERLGRGKGYFDSYLKDFKGIKVGVFFSFQEVENVYSEEHDESLDIIITEKDILIRGI